MVYQWKSGARIEADPQKVGERVEKLSKLNGGGVTAERLLSDARNPKSPLHPCFEWDDAKAAEAHRIAQAGHVLRCLVKVEAHERKPVPVRAFVPVFREPDAERREYVGITDALNDPLMREQVIASARRELAAWREKYRLYDELAELFEVIDRQFELAVVA